MKKGLIILALTLLLTGCGKKDENIIETNTDTLQPETQIEQVEDKQEVVVQPEVKIEEKIEPKVDETKQKHAELYAEVLNKYVECIRKITENPEISENWDKKEEIISQMIENMEKEFDMNVEIGEISPIYTIGHIKNLDDRSYALNDINNDGIKELFIFDNVYGNSVQLMLTIINGKLELIAGSRDRVYTSLCEGNLLKVSASGGADRSIVNYYVLNNEGNVDFIKSFNWDMIRNEVYNEETGTYDYSIDEVDSFFSITDSNGTRNVTYDELFSELEEFEKKYPKLENIEKRSLADPIKIDM